MFCAKKVNRGFQQPALSWGETGQRSRKTHDHKHIAQDLSSLMLVVVLLTVFKTPDTSETSLSLCLAA